MDKILHTAVSGKGTAYEINAAAVYCGSDLNVTITGGKEHIGAVSLAVYEPERRSATVSTLCVYSHRDDVIAAEAAKRISSLLRCTVCVSVGIHLDNAGSNEILQLSENADAAIDLLVSGLT